MLDKKEIEIINLRVNLILSSLDKVHIHDALITISTCYQLLLERGLTLGMGIDKTLKVIDGAHDEHRRDLIKFAKEHNSIKTDSEMSQ